MSFHLDDVQCSRLSGRIETTSSARQTRARLPKMPSTTREHSDWTRHFMHLAEHSNRLEGAPHMQTVQELPFRLVRILLGEDVEAYGCVQLVSCRQLARLGQ
eukprot:3982322-Pyramimonas_sp.AAC.1